jgi:isoleucyl-tRNA synthetase
MNLKDTLNLPDADFTIPMKAGLPQLEPSIQKTWDGMDIYRTIQRQRANAPEFIFHDGPPYTNGPIHIGTALNKILKDFVVKSQTLLGKRVPYIPGFDNHGLPIEQAVMKKFAEKKVSPTVVELRKACREHAEHYIGVQTEQFKRLGVFGMWDKPYTSMAFPYEAELIRVFRRLVEGGYIYRGLRPVLWSPTSQTALADTEIVYEDYTSRSIYVRFRLKDDPNQVFQGLENLHTIIWTTTPWTIPANLAVAFHPRFTYDIVRVGSDHYVLLHELVEKTMAKCGITEWEVVRSIKGQEAEFAVFSHPIYGRDSLAVLAEYVTTEDGTGVVHTAPGHGRDDFFTGQKYKLPVLCPVNEKGVLTEEAGEFAGIYYRDCDTAVVNRLEELGALLHAEDYKHSYPHAERDGKPVIFRATEQWFIGIDHPFHLDPSITLRQKMLAEVDACEWVPDTGYKRIRAMVENRPDWCISRQRPWGVGIPVFYGAESGEPVLDITAIEAVAKLVEERGSDAWYEASPAEILPPGYKHPVTGETEFRKEVDVFDVWFDSGSTGICVLEGNVESEWMENMPADMYLEGSDQHRGWFNVSLVITTACKGHAPYRRVVTHGFVTDEKGQKMSKRLGNVVDPVKVCDQFGADILRYWTASVDYSDDVPCSDALLQTAGEGYRRIRNTLRYLLGNVADYGPPMDIEDLLPFDRWIVDKAHAMAARCLKGYAEYRFNQVLSEIHHFCVNEVSAVYSDAVKDRMYCDGRDWPTRRSAQAACHEVLVVLTKLIDPILMHTAEEVYTRIPGIERLPSVHMESLDVSSAVPATATALIDDLLDLRAKAFAEVEKWRAEMGVKDTQDIGCAASGSSNAVLGGELLGDQLPILFKMASVELSVGDFHTSFQLSEFLKCDRSRIRRPDVEERVIEGETFNLTARDRKVLGV